MEERKSTPSSPQQQSTPPTPASESTASNRKASRSGSIETYGASPVPNHSPTNTFQVNRYIPLFIISDEIPQPEIN